MKTFRHSGKCGDLVMSLPAIKALGGGILFLPQNGPEVKGLLDNMREFLLQQPYISEVREYPSGLAYGEKVQGIHIDYDLDEARNQPNKGVTHLVKRHLDAFGIRLDNWKAPWLSVERMSHVYDPYSLINYTGRHVINELSSMKSRVNWKDVVERIEHTVYFVGTVEEYKWFHDHIAPVTYLPTSNALQLAQAIAGAQDVYCNQSLVLALCQGLGKPYYCDFKPAKFNCRLNTSLEHAL